MRASTIKNTGYLISMTSVAMMGVVSWKTASTQPVLAACLIGGMVTSVMGMALRWISSEIEERQKRK